ncbi:MAG: methylated-DNA--[protein]-cysteine S-methyltransferase [Rhizobacter sp.]
MTFATASIHSACTAQMLFDSPLGPLLLARTAHGLAGAWFEGQRDHPLQIDAPEVADDPLLTRTAAQLQAYFDGVPSAFDVPLDLRGTAFQLAVWNALLEIGRGATCSYGDIARRVGRAAAVRAVGAAVGMNPVSIIVPCHRVIGSNGALTGYAGGLHRKVALLRLEAGHGGVHAPGTQGRLDATWAEPGPLSVSAAARP